MSINKSAKIVKIFSKNQQIVKKTNDQQLKTNRQLHQNQIQTQTEK
jgi:hypothetical protein